jgi:hypothetical protein
MLPYAPPDPVERPSKRALILQPHFVYYHSSPIPEFRLEQRRKYKE